MCVTCYIISKVFEIKFGSLLNKVTLSHTVVDLVHLTESIRRNTFFFSDERRVLRFGRGGGGQAFAVGHETSAASGRQRQPLVRLPQPKLISG
jgi:hypothetical protein